MSATGQMRGHPVTWDGEHWRYEDGTLGCQHEGREGGNQVMSKAEQIITLVGDLEEENLHLQNNLYFLQEQLDRARFRQDQVLRALDAEFIRLQDLDSAIPLTANYEERRRRHNENANSRLSLNRVAQALFNISLYTAASSVRQEKVRYEKSQA